MKYQGFYDSVINVQGVPDRPYTASDFCNHLKALIGNGIGITNATGDNAWKVVKTGNLKCKVTLGNNSYNFASLQGNPFAVDTALEFELSLGTNRWDAIMIRADATSNVRATDVIAQEGNIELTRTDDVYDLRLARVHVVNNEITEIIDDRLDYDVCGIADGLATVPVDELRAVIAAIESESLVAFKDGTKQINLNAEMVGGVKSPTLYANARYHTPTYSHVNSLPVDSTNYIPTMESNEQDGFIITHNLSTGSYMEPFLMFSSSYSDRSETSEADNKQAYFSGTSKQVVIELPKLAKIRKCKYNGKRTSSDYGDIYFYASNDGTNWTKIGSGTSGSSFAEKEVTISNISNTYYKYIKVYSNGAYLKKLNFDVTYITSLDVNRLDLSFGFDSLVAGQKFGITIPNDYIQDLKGKMQIDSFGYKDLPNNLIPGNNYCLMYNGTMFVPVEIPLIGTYEGNSVDGREIDFGFPIKRIHIHRTNVASPNTSYSFDSAIIAPEIPYYSAVSINGTKVKFDRTRTGTSIIGSQYPLNKTDDEYVYEVYG